MKNKAYIVCLNSNKKLSIFNVMRFKKIDERNLNNLTFEKAVEILESLDPTTLRTWFSTDIKLGVIALTFQKENLFNNLMNFNTEFLEKILEKFNPFSGGPIEHNYKFLDQNSSSMSREGTPMSSTLDDKSKSMTGYSPNVSRKGMTSPIYDKATTNGYNLIQNIFTNYFANIHTKYTEFFENNFYDTKGYIKKRHLNFNDNLEYKNKVINSNYFIYSTYDNLINVGPYLKDINQSFHFPNFLKELFQLVNNYI